LDFSYCIQYILVDIW